MPTATLHVLYTPPYKALPLWMGDTLGRLARRGWRRLRERLSGWR